MSEQNISFKKGFFGFKPEGVIEYVDELLRNSDFDQIHISELEKKISETDTVIAGRDSIINELRKTVAERDARIADLEKELKDVVVNMPAAENRCADCDVQKKAQALLGETLFDVKKFTRYLVNDAKKKANDTITAAQGRAGVASERAKEILFDVDGISQSFSSQIDELRNTLTGLSSKLDDFCSEIRTGASSASDAPAEGGNDFDLPEKKPVAADDALAQMKAEIYGELSPDELDGMRRFGLTEDAAAEEKAPAQTPKAAAPVIVEQPADKPAEEVPVAVEEATAGAEPVPAQEEYFVEEEPPVEEETPVEEEPSVEEALPAQEELPVEEELSAEDEMKRAEEEFYSAVAEKFGGYQPEEEEAPAAEIKPEAKRETVPGVKDDPLPVYEENAPGAEAKEEAPVPEFKVPSFTLGKTAPETKTENLPEYNDAPAEKTPQPQYDNGFKGFGEFNISSMDFGDREEATKVDAEKVGPYDQQKKNASPFPFPSPFDDMFTPIDNVAPADNGPANVSGAGRPRAKNGLPEDLPVFSEREPEPEKKTKENFSYVNGFKLNPVRKPTAGPSVQDPIPPTE